MLIFISDNGNDFRQKAKFEQFSYLRSKWVITLETTHNITNAFGPETVGNGYSRSFAKETRALKMVSVAADHRKLTTTS